MKNKRFEECDAERVKFFAKDNIGVLFNRLQETIERFKLDKIIEDVRVEDSVLFVNGGITVYADTKNMNGIGVIRQIPCWVVSTCIDGDECELIRTANNNLAIKKVIEEAISDTFFHLLN